MSWKPKLAVLQVGSSIPSKLVSIASKHPFATSQQSDTLKSYLKKGAKPKRQPTASNPITSLHPQAATHVSQAFQNHVSFSLQGNTVPHQHASVAMQHPTLQQHLSLSTQCNAASSLQAPNGKTQQIAMSLPFSSVSQTKPAASKYSPPFQLQSTSVGYGSQPPYLHPQPMRIQGTQSLQDQQPTVELYHLLQQQNDITSLLDQMQSSQSLPRLESPTYNGDPMQFNVFMKAFEHCVEAKTNCKGDCLYYLELYTRGQPRDIVHSCLHMTAEKGFAVAKRLLKGHFGNEFKIIAAYMEKVTGWPTVKPEDTKALKAYGLFLCECSNAMEELQYLEELNMPANIKILSQKLPHKLRDKWRTKACEILEKTGQRACFNDIVKFIEWQVRITSDPVFGDIRDTQTGKGVNKPNKPRTNLQLRTVFLPMSQSRIKAAMQALTGKKGFFEQSSIQH